MPSEPFDGLYPDEPDERNAVLKEAARACRLYSEWCANWGLDRNMKVATEAANECAAMLENLPANLPDDDEEAAMVIFRTTPEFKKRLVRYHITPAPDA